MHAFPRLSAHKHGIICGNGQRVFNFCAHALRFCAGQVYLVYGGDNFQIVIHGQHCVCHCLRFNALRGIHHTHSAFTRSQTATYFICEIHMAWCVNQVQLINLAIFRLIFHTHSLAFYGYAALAFYIHGV